MYWSVSAPDQIPARYLLCSKKSFILDFERLYALHQCASFFIVRAKTKTKLKRLYQCRWRVELFFKWIKQHLRIKAFYGTSENAVKTQIWIAISVYVLVAIIKKQLKLDLSLYTILQIFSITLFEKMPILQALTETDYKNKITSGHIQLNLFES